MNTNFNSIQTIQLVSIKYLANFYDLLSSYVVKDGNIELPKRLNLGQPREQNIIFLYHLLQGIGMKCGAIQI